MTIVRLGRYYHVVKVQAALQEHAQIALKENLRQAAIKLRVQIVELENTTIKLKEKLRVIAKFVGLGSTTIKLDWLIAKIVGLGNTTIKLNKQQSLIAKLVNLESFKMSKVRIVASRTAFALVAPRVRTHLMLT